MSLHRSGRKPEARAKWKTLIRTGVTFPTASIAPDIPQLAELIVGQMATGYGTKGITSLTRPGVKTQFTQWVEAALVANIRPDYTVAMDKGEEKGFDALKAIAGDGIVAGQGHGVCDPICTSAHRHQRWYYRHFRRYKR